MFLKINKCLEEIQVINPKEIQVIKDNNLIVEKVLKE